jgi:hypothetical protein
MGYGQQGHIGISFQQTFGVQFVSSMHYFPFVSESINESIAELASENLSSRLDEPDAYEGAHEIAGDVVMDIHPVLIGKLFKAWSGQASLTEIASTGTFNQHIFTPRQDDWIDEVCALPPMSIEVYRDTGSAYLYYDMLLNQLALEIAQGAIYKCTASFIGAHFAWLAKSTTSYHTGSYFAWDVVSVSLAGTGVSDVSQLTVTCNNNLAAKSYLNLQKYAGRILRDGFRTVEVAGTMLLNGDTQARAYRARTQQRLVITATDPTTLFASHTEMVIDVPKMVYTEFPANIGGPGLIEVGFSGKGKYDATSGYAVQFSLKNVSPAY